MADPANHRHLRLLRRKPDSGRCHVQRVYGTLLEILGNGELLVLENSSGQRVRREIVNPDASFSLTIPPDPPIRAIGKSGTQ